jgi:DNA primase
VFHDPARTTLTLAEILSRFDEAEPEGNAFVALCPAHADSRPSLRIAYTEDKQVLLKCRAGCSLDDVLTAVGMVKPQLFDVEPGDLTEVRPISREARTLGPGELAPLRMYLSRAEAALDDQGADALSYAARRFGVSAEMARELGIGFDPSDLDAGRIVLSRRNYRNAPRLVVPFVNFDGDAHGFQARALTNAEPRWSGPNNPDGTTWGRYGFLSAGSERPEILLTEGPGDGITAVAAGYDAVVIPGASRGTSPGLADELAAGLKGRPVIVAGDADTAGETFARNVAAALTSRGIDVRELALPTGVNDLADWYGRDGEGFSAALADAVVQAQAVQTEGDGDDTGDSEGDQKAADGEPAVSRAAVVYWARRNYRFFRSEDGQPYAVKRDGARIAMEIGDKLKRDIMFGYSADRERRTKKLAIVRDEMMRSVMQYLVAEAERSGDVENVALRAAQVDDGRRLVVDLGDATGRIVDVSAAGWEVREPRDGDPLFRRTRPTLPLPEPVAGGSLDVLRELLGFGEKEARWLLVRGWLATAFFADYARPLLWMTGSHGSGKTTRAKLVLNLVNPAENLGKEPGKKEWDDSTSAMSRYVVSYDNLTSISQAVSDWLCRLVTGVTEDRRVLYSQDEVHTVSYRRSGVVTSITMPAGLASDAMERISAVHLDRVRDGGRRSEEMILAAYDAARPELLGAVLDDMARILRHLDTVRADTTRNWPRMADFGMALAALDEALGIDADAGHFAAYTGALHDEMAERALDDEFTVAVLGLVKKRSSGDWRGTATDLLKALDDVAGWDWAQNKRPDWWPSSPRKLKDQLKRHAESLRHAGVEFLEPPRRGSAREVILRRVGDLAAVPDAADDATGPFNVVSLPRK